jgi:hypothetical protein
VWVKVRVFIDILTCFTVSTNKSSVHRQCMYIVFILQRSKSLKQLQNCLKKHKVAPFSLFLMVSSIKSMHVLLLFKIDFSFSYNLISCEFSVILLSLIWNFESLLIFFYFLCISIICILYNYLLCYILKI